MFKEYGNYDATGLAELVARGEVRPAELLEAAIARAEAVNPKLNAINIPMLEIGRARAGERLSGPFAGVPFLIALIIRVVREERVRTVEVDARLDQEAEVRQERQRSEGVLAEPEDMMRPWWLDDPSLAHRYGQQGQQG